MVKDIVCGMQIEEKKATGPSSYKGNIYYFCSAACKVKFEKNPENFIEK